MYVYELLKLLCYGIFFFLEETKVYCLIYDGVDWIFAIFFIFKHNNNNMDMYIFCESVLCIVLEIGGY
jgi:hypothetical protein